VYEGKVLVGLQEPFMPNGTRNWPRLLCSTMVLALFVAYNFWRAWRIKIE
jgi:hypothetical protein